MTNVVAFDLNKTLIKESSWYDLNLAMGITPQEDELLYRLGPESEGILGHEDLTHMHFSPLLLTK
ncbi:MAG: hypothetical protein ACREBW_02755 [Candidatus Micrarchaeaceae archaeon]